MVKFVSLSSGSNGNCYYIGNEHTALLIDAGIGPRTIKKRLLEHGISMETVEFVLVTHDHIDHIKSLGSLAERLHLPVYASEKLHGALERHFCTRGKLSGCIRKTILDRPCEYKGVRFIPFEVPHDATETVGYYIDFYGTKFTFLTDAGAVTESVIKYCKMSGHLIFEANYDLNMLLRGSYPPELKIRIMKGHGHLSNEQTASALKIIYHRDLSHIFLCHLSENNNTPAVAYDTIAKGLSDIGVKVGTDVALTCLPRRQSSQLFTF